MIWAVCESRPEHDSRHSASRGCRILIRFRNTSRAQHRTRDCAYSTFFPLPLYYFIHHRLLLSTPHSLSRLHLPAPCRSCSSASLVHWSCSFIVFIPSAPRSLSFTSSFCQPSHALIHGSSSLILPQLPLLTPHSSPLPLCLRDLSSAIAYTRQAYSEAVLTRLCFTNAP